MLKQVFAYHLLVAFFRFPGDMCNEPNLKVKDAHTRKPLSHAMILITQIRVLVQTTSSGHSQWDERCTSVNEAHTNGATFMGAPVTLQGD